MLDTLFGHSLLFVFLAMGLGAGLGTLSVRGVSFGPAAALFVGLGFGAIDERISGAAGLGTFKELGLVLFTYTVGLASGPTFARGLKQGGLKALGVTVAAVAALAAACAGVAAALGLSAAERAGLFAGSTTNTPALQAAAEALDGAGDPVVAYSLAYPAAVASMLLVLTLVLGRRMPAAGSAPAARTARRRSPGQLDDRGARRRAPDVGRIARPLPRAGVQPGSSRRHRRRRPGPPSAPARRCGGRGRARRARGRVLRRGGRAQRPPSPARSHGAGLPSHRGLQQGDRREPRGRARRPP
ncbi:MAG: hypothetical protein R2705_15100 [Ilumatobacteraceae bacterium]